jgi:NTE family protein
MLDSVAERPVPTRPQRKSDRSGERASAVRTVNLALQGGGAHGAFCWGVLDRLLEDERIGFDGISATSAGSMNAAVMAYGFAEGGREGARVALAGFWRRVGHAATTSPLQPSPWDRFARNHTLQNSPAFVMFDLFSRIFSPNQFNPVNYNPLRQILEASVDFEVLRTRCPIKMFISATNVRTGKIKVFRNDELSADAILASACLPFLFHTIEIDGEAYWDGGYMGNPAIYPLIYHCDASDVVVVHINPIMRDEVPTTAGAILSRVNEISFNSSLMREMRAIAFVSRMIDEGTVAPGRMKRMLIHSIADDELMRSLCVTSKLNADWDFLQAMRDAGRARAGAWSADCFDRLGHESTIDIAGNYL